MVTTLRHCQLHYFTKPIQCGVTHVKQGIHNTASICRMPEGPKVVLSTVSFISQALILIPPLTESMQPVKECVKEIKRFFSLLRGPQALNNLINKPQTCWKTTTVNVSGTALFVFSILGYVKKFKWSNLSTIDKALNKIPKVNVLPYSGLLALSQLGLQTSLLLVAIDEKNQQEMPKQALNALIIAQRVCAISSIILVSTTTVTGVGLVIAAPTATGLSLLGSSLDLTNYIVKSRYNNVPCNTVMAMPK